MVARRPRPHLEACYTVRGRGKRHGGVRISGGHPGPRDRRDGVVAVGSACSGVYQCVYSASVDSRVVIRKIEAAGWKHVRTSGSHWHFKHPSRPGIVTVPHPKRDLPKGTLRSIERQSVVDLS